MTGRPGRGPEWVESVLKDFAPVSNLVDADAVLAVNPALTAKQIRAARNRDIPHVRERTVAA